MGVGGSIFHSISWILVVSPLLLLLLLPDSFGLVS